ncbi:MAG: tripartite tricarboxylate transporter substrate binding protein [Betaproteobacteria bacterium]|nr:tripartite tricarboxylate transporter substrate binding protein [Betaproteobacteria bacterium]
MRRFLFAMLLVVLGPGAGDVFAQSYPNKPVRFVVNMSAGGALDTTARLVSAKMADSLNQPFVVENRGGVGGNIGMNAVAKAAPDGYTVLVTTTGLALSPALYRKLPFDAAADFIPVTQLVASTMVLIGGSRLPAASTRELITLAKSRPGALNYGHTGVGSQGQLAVEVLKLSSGTDIVGVPYKGEALVSTALMAGEVDVAVLPLSSNLQYFKSGRLRPLAVISARRSATLPDVPAIEESVVTGYEAASWHGLFVPAKTPRDVVELLHREAVKALNMPDVRVRLVASGLEIVGSSPAEFDVKYRADLTKFAKIVKEARIPLQD